ncbi:ionotropic receptor 93a-like isoform X2 [Centruroides sculpturatus]|uniref:ionotropic receptor 93a-like isoform X2 n=1 Tax=Centruroides sculpturatus TaxID=218467 RepID=UPI000C6D8D2F|nr:ionotropic receptor 93a-like isoform X2 [Centruroides sculpturatus]
MIGKAKNVLRVAGKATFPFFTVSTESHNKSVKFGGLIGNLVTAVTTQLQLRAEFIESESLSKRLDNGSWTGRVGKIQKNEADLMFTIMKAEEMEIIDYTDPFLFDEARFLVKKPEEASKMFIISRPFNYRLWIATFVTLILGIPILYFLLKAEWKLKSIKLRRGWKRIAWMLFVGFANQGDSLIDNIGHKVRWMLSAWLLTCTILVACYAGNLASYMTFPGFQHVPNTIPQLQEAVAAGEYYIVVKEKSSITQSIENSNSTLMKLFAQSVRNRNGLIKDMGQCFYRTAQDRCAFINYEIVFDLMTPKNLIGKFMISNDQFLTISVAFAVRKDFPLKKEVDRITSAAVESGLLIKWKKNIIDKLPKKEKDLNTIRPLNLLDLQGGFILLFLGYAIGIVCLIIELIIDFFLRCRKKKKVKVIPFSHYERIYY